MKPRPRWYLGVEVEPTFEPNERGYEADYFGPGWFNARWPDGRVYTHWCTQLCSSAEPDATVEDSGISAL